MSKRAEVLYSLLDGIDNALFDSILEATYSGWVKPNDCAIDVGAQVGRHTVPLAKAVGPGGKVLAFEPLPSMRIGLAKALRTAKADQQVVVFDDALSNVEGDAEFIHVVDAPGLSGLRERSAQQGHKVEKIRVKTRVLDDLLSVDGVTSVYNISFIKIDAEGADFHILNGAERTLRRDRPLVVFECGKINALPAKSYSYSEAEFRAFFRRMDYVLCDLLGLPYDPIFWDKPSLGDLVAIPAERDEEGKALVAVSALQVLSQEIRSLRGQVSSKN